MTQSANVVQLKPRTLQAFEAYIREAEAKMEPSLRGRASFLWSDSESNRAQQVRQGQIVAQLWAGDVPVKITNGLIHDWVGSVFIPQASMAQALALVQNYSDHQTVYAPDVIGSRLISRAGNNFQITLRLLKKKMITVVLDTDHDVHYSEVDATRWFCRSRSTRIVEVEDAGTPEEKISPPDSGYGFLWRLNSYWKFDEKKGAAGVASERSVHGQRGEGIFIECRAISLTRDIPLGLGWIIEPIIRNLPQESLVNTLDATRRALVRPA